jgi:hypothetical protein
MAFNNQSLQDSLTSLYTPPYSQRASNVEAEENEIAKKKSDSFREVKIEKSNFSSVKAAAMQHNAAQAEDEEAQNKSPLVPILLLSLGSNLFLLGIFQFFFSQGGFLRLEWDASYWFIYSLLSLPFLYLGIKKVSKF